VICSIILILTLITIKYITMNQNVWPFNKKKSKGFPVYIEMPAVVNNMVAQQLVEYKAKYRAIVNKKQS